MITTAQAMYYVGLEPEFADETDVASVNRAIKSAVVWLRGAAGPYVDLDNPIADELLLMAVGELFEFRQLTDYRTTKKVYAAINRMADDMLMQLKYADVETGCPAIEAGYETGTDGDS